MSYWQHSICRDCWNKKHPDRVAHKVTHISEEKTCCLCRKKHNSGIFLRCAGNVMICQGNCDN